MGLWHGAAWTFAVWGLYHAALVLAYRTIRPLAALPERHPRIAWALCLALAMALAAVAAAYGCSRRGGNAGATRRAARASR